MHANVRAVFPGFSKKFEGYVHWMYLDVKSLVTIGVGNLIDPVEAALGLVFVDKDTGARASVDQIKAEWQKLKDTPGLAQKKYTACEGITRLRLADATIDSLVLSRLDANEAYLKKTFTE